MAQDAGRNSAVRSLALRTKSRNALAVYDIVTTPGVLARLIDLYVMVRLHELVWFQEGKARQLFGEKGSQAIQVAYNEVGRELSEIADLAMKAEARESLDRQILEWRKRNPETVLVSTVRFADLPDPTGKSILNPINSLFSVLNPLEEANQTVADTARMADRMFYFTKRFSTLVSWQAESAIEDTLAQPEVSRILGDVDQTSGSIDRISKEIVRLPETVANERKEILAAWDAREGKINSTVREVRSTVTEAKDFAGNATEAASAGKALAAEVNEVVKSLDQWFKNMDKASEASRNNPPPPPSRPFDITEYTAAATEATKLVGQINQTIKESQNLLGSPAWDRRQEDVSRLASQTLIQAGERGKEWINYLTLRIIGILVAFFVLLYLYRVAPRPKKQASAG
jgi:methyl-accepting chemotaxis protein